MPWNHAAANVSRQDAHRNVKRSRRVDDDIHLSPAGYEQLSKWVTAALSGTAAHNPGRLLATGTNTKCYYFLDRHYLCFCSEELTLGKH